MTATDALSRDDVSRVPHFRRKVIVADDVQVNRAILSCLLRKLGYEVVEASTGEQAVRAFESLRTSSGRSDLLCVLLDINMPDMDGLEAAKRIRALEAQTAASPLVTATFDAQVPELPTVLHAEDSSTSDIADSPLDTLQRVPIWAVSACSVSEQYLSPAMAGFRPDDNHGPPWRIAGIDAFLAKPVDHEQLMERICGLQADLSTSCEPFRDCCSQGNSGAGGRDLKRRLTVLAHGGTRASKRQSCGAACDGMTGQAAEDVGAERRSSVVSSA